MDEQISPHVLFQRTLQDILEHFDRMEKSGVEEITRAVPMLFPVIESTVSCNQRIIERTGLVQRHLLSVVKRFQKVDVDYISQLTGLASHRIEQCLRECILAGAPIREENSCYYYCGTEEDSLEEFEREVQHEIVLLRNGINGELLPVKMLKEHKNCVFNLNDKPANQGYLTALREFSIVMLPAARCAPFDIENHADLPLAERQRFGLPAGMTNLVSSMPHREVVRYIPVFAIIYSNADITVWTGSSSVSELHLPGSHPADYLAKAGTGINFDTNCKRWKKRWTSTDYSDGEKSELINEQEFAVFTEIPASTYRVSLKPGNTITWELLNSSSPETLALKNLGWGLFRGWSWNNNADYTLTKFCPADAYTARQTLLLRGSAALKDIMGLPSDIEEQTQWWDNWQRKNGGDDDIERIPFTELLDASVLYKDTEFTEWVNDIRLEYAGRMNAAVQPITDHSATYIYDATPEHSHHAIIKSMIESAQEYIEIICPVITDNSVIDWLIAASSRNIVVKVITELGKKRNSTTNLREFSSAGFDGENSLRDNLQAVRKLASEKVLIRCPELTPHAKVIIVDGTAVLMTSANLNPNSLGTGNNPAKELGLYVNNGDLTSKAHRMFTSLWDNSPHRYYYRNTQEHGSTYDLIQEKHAETDGGSYSFESAGVRIYFFDQSPKDCLGAKLAEIINMAQQTISLYAMSMYDTRKNKDFHMALIAALKRGVQVTVFLRSAEENSFSPEDWPDPSTKELLEAGIRLETINGLHAKAIVVDNYCYGLFSGNLNPYSLGGEPECGNLEAGIFGERSNDIFGKFKDIHSTR